MLHLGHQSTLGLSLSMVLFPCLCNFLVLQVMMSESRRYGPWVMLLAIPQVAGTSFLVMVP
uniref:Uncharacterized protein n=1 Tax=Rhizophora mucronata TaxID=61149 RepID=A0A2P2M0R2_RHIMU